MGKRKKKTNNNTGDFINDIKEELGKLKFKELKMLYEEQAENNFEQYIQSLVLLEMKRRNPKWEP